MAVLNPIANELMMQAANFGAGQVNTAADNRRADESLVLRQAEAAQIQQMRELQIAEMRRARDEEILGISNRSRADKYLLQLLQETSQPVDPMAMMMDATAGPPEGLGNEATRANAFMRGQAMNARPTVFDRAMREQPDTLQYASPKLLALVQNKSDADASREVERLRSLINNLGPQGVTKISPRVVDQAIGLGIGVQADYLPALDRQKRVAEDESVREYAIERLGLDPASPQAERVRQFSREAIADILGEKITNERNAAAQKAAIEKVVKQNEFKVQEQKNKQEYRSAVMKDAPILMKVMNDSRAEPEDRYQAYVFLREYGFPVEEPGTGKPTDTNAALAKEFEMQSKLADAHKKRADSAYDQLQSAGVIDPKYKQIDMKLVNKDKSGRLSKLVDTYKEANEKYQNTLSNAVTMVNVGRSNIATTNKAEQAGDGVASGEPALLSDLDKSKGIGAIVKKAEAGEQLTAEEDAAINAILDEKERAKGSPLTEQEIEAALQEAAIGGT